MNGFTLVEMLVVLTIVGVMSVSAAATLSRANDTGAAGKVAAELDLLLRKTRRDALSTAEPVEIVLDPSNGAYWVVAGPGRRSVKRGSLNIPDGAELTAATRRVRFRFHYLSVQSDTITVKDAQSSIPVFIGAAW